MKKLPKFAVLSHILPPSPSGQAVMLYRLLRRIEKNRYCLISVKDYKKNDSHLASKKLPAKYHKLKASFLYDQPWVVNSVYSLPFFGIDIYLKAKRIEKILKKENAEILIACTGDFQDFPAAYLAAKRAGVKLVAYIFDDYVYQWTGFQRKLAAFLMPKMTKDFALTIAPNEYLKKDYDEKYGLNCELIHNPCLPINLKSLKQKNQTLDHKDINIVYTGMIYHAHYDAFHNLIKAVEKTDKINGRSLEIHLFTLQEREDLASIGIGGGKVHVHPHVSQQEINAIQRQADVLFLPLAFKTTIPEVIRTSAPAKTGEYLSIGRHFLRLQRDSLLQGRVLD